MKKRICAALCIAAVLFVCGCSPNVKTGDDLSGKRVAVLSGSAAEIYVRRFGATAAEYDTDAELIAAVEGGLADCAVTDAAYAKAFTKNGLKKEKNSLVTEEFKILVAKENADLVKEMNSAIAALKESGTLDELALAWCGVAGLGSKYTGGDTVYEHTITLAVDCMQSPYAYYDWGGSIIGLNVDIARAICDKLGVNLEVVDISSKDFVDAVSSGRVTFAMGMVTNAKGVLLTDGYYTSNQIILNEK